MPNQLLLLSVVLLCCGFTTVSSRPELYSKRRGGNDGLFLRLDLRPCFGGGGGPVGGEVKRGGGNGFFEKFMMRRRHTRDGIDYYLLGLANCIASATRPRFGKRSQQHPVTNQRGPANQMDAVQFRRMEEILNNLRHDQMLPWQRDRSEDEPSGGVEQPRRPGRETPREDAFKRGVITM